MIKILQGDAVVLPVKLTLNGDAVTGDDVESVRFSISSLVKTYPGEVTYSDTGQQFLLPLSQEETFELLPGDTRIIIRPKFKDLSVVGWRCSAALFVEPCEDKAVI